MKGTIRDLPVDKTTGLRKFFGFLKDEEGGDRFFYGGAVSPLSVAFEELEVGDIVTFEPITADDGRLRAVTVALFAKDGDREMSAPNFTPMEGEHGQEESDRPPTARYGNNRHQGD